MLKNEIMKDSKINMNKPPLTESEINAAKDFDKILLDQNFCNGIYF